MLNKGYIWMLKLSLLGDENVLGTFRLLYKIDLIAKSITPKLAYKIRKIIA
jgi:hypothetical protein